MSKALYQSEGKLGGELLDSLSAEASTASIRASFFDSDNKSNARIPDVSTLLYTIDPERTQGKPTEFILVTSHSTTDGITTLVTVVRGLQRDSTIDVSGSAARAQDWDAGTPITVTTIPFNANLIKAYFEGIESVPGDMQFGGDPDFDGIVDFDREVNIPIYQNVAARDAAITSPREGSSVKLTDEGIITDFLGGVWVTRAADTTANASETVTGRVRLNTTARTDAATDLSGGDPTVNKPSEIARVIQESKYNSGSSSEGDDDYVVTLVPAITAYSQFQLFILDADTANIGACTVDFNGVGVKNIKLPNGNDPSDGDVSAGPNILIYDGTNFVLIGSPTPATLTDGSEASLLHNHVAPTNYNASSEIQLLNDFSDLTVTNTGGSILKGGWINLTSGTTGSSQSHTTILTDSEVSGKTNLRYYADVEFSSLATDLNLFLGFEDATPPLITSNAHTDDHAAFLYDQPSDTLIASVADGTTQNTFTITGITLTDLNSFYITKNGSVYEFYVNDDLKWTSDGNEPDGGLSGAHAGFINFSTTARNLNVLQHSISYTK